MPFSATVIAKQAEGYAEVVLKDDAGQNVAKVPNGETMTVLENRTETVKVRWSNIEGWARATNLKVPGPEPKAATPVVDPTLLSESELRGMNLLVLKQKARGIGITEETIDAMDDEADPKKAVIDLIVQKQAAKPSWPPGVDPTLRSQLNGMTLAALKKKARELEITEEAIETVDGEADPKKALIDEIVLKQCAKRGNEPKACALGIDPTLLSELSGMTLAALKKRAREAGISEETLSAIDGEEDPKNAIINKIVAKPVGAANTREGISDLIRRASSLGATREEVDDALEEKISRNGLMSLIKAKEAAMACGNRGELVRQALNLGVTEKEIDDAFEAPDPREALMSLVRSKKEASPPAQAPAREQSMAKAMQSDGHAEVIIRDARNQGQIVAMVPNGESLIILQKEGESSKVKWNEIEGWVKSCNIQDVSDPLR